MTYALVRHHPGTPGGKDVESFTSSRAEGCVAMMAFTDPRFAQTLVTQLKPSSGGEMPRYYQVQLTVKSTDEMPREITYVLTRQLHCPGKS